MDTVNTVDTVLERCGVPKIEARSTDLEFSLCDLRTTLWGKPAPTASVWNLELARHLNFTSGQFVILEQYAHVLDQLKTHRQSTRRFSYRGMLITGSPGIGKTCCLWYLLVMHLCKAEPVVLFYHDGLYVFTGLGFYALTRRMVGVLTDKVFRNVLCLVDTDPTGSSLWPTILSPSACFTVVASSPQRQKHHNWVKQCNIVTLVLDAPSKADLIKLLQTGDEETLDRLLDIFGPNIRALGPIIDMSSHELEIAIQSHIDEIRQHLENLGPTQLKSLLNRPNTIQNTFSHTLVHTYGVRGPKLVNQTTCHRIRTRLIFRLLLQLHQQSRLAGIRDMYELFSASSSLAVSRGCAFEVLCHAMICEMDELILHPVSEHNNKLKKTVGSAPVHVSIGKRLVEIYRAGSGVETTVDTGCYYVPAEGNNPTFDAFIPGEASIALQMFVGRSHTFKKRGVAMFRKRLMAFYKGRDWKVNKMKFVFVVPAGHASGFEVPTCRLRDVDFFVLELDVGKLYERFHEDKNCEVDDDDDDDDIDMDDEMTS